jgi:hypothetical protein
VILITQNLKLTNIRTARPIFVCGHVVIDVYDMDGLAQDQDPTNRRQFRLTSDYQIAIETNGQLWGCTYPQQEEEFFRPMEDGICGHAHGRDIVRAATLHCAETMEGAASLLSSAPGKTPLLGFEWNLTMPLEAPAEATQDADSWPDPSAVVAQAKVVAVEPSSLATVADALRLMCDVVKHRQNVKQLAAESDRVARPRRRLLSHTYG